MTWKNYYTETNLRFFGSAYAGFREKRAPIEAGFAIRALGLRKGEKVLDLCCGMGHNSVHLASQGLDVVAVDFSRYSIETGRELMKRRGVSVLFHEGDAREIPWVGEFDAAVMLFNSFGYFEGDEDNAKVLEKLAASLKPKGRFLIEALSRGFAVAKSAKGSDEFSLEDGSSQKVIYRFDPSTDFFFMNRAIVTQEETRELSFAQKAYSPEKLEKMLGDSGLRMDRVYGGYEETPWTPDDAAMVLTGLRK